MTVSLIGDSLPARDAVGSRVEEERLALRHACTLMVSRHWASPRESAACPTDIKGVVAMCGWDDLGSS